MYMCVGVNSISTYHALCIQRENNVRNLFSTLRQCKGSSQTECSKHMFVRKPSPKMKREKKTNNTWTSGSLKVESAPWSRTPRPPNTECKQRNKERKTPHPYPSKGQVFMKHLPRNPMPNMSINTKAPTPKEETPHHTKNSTRNNHCNAHPVHSIPKSAPTTSNTKTNHSPSSSAWGTTTLCTTRKKRER